MKGYVTSNGYMGYVDGKYILFASDKEYFEFMEAVATPTDDNTADGNLDKYRVQLIWRRYTSVLTT